MTDAPTPLAGPDFSGRTPQQIITENVVFDSVGYAFRSLSWIDIAKRENNICAMQYAGHDVRQAIEHLLFEVLVLSTGTNLDQAEYDKCRGSSTKLHKFIKLLQPHYVQLVEFMQAMLSLYPGAPPIVSWDLSALMKHWGMVSDYLHWSGGPVDTVESVEWFQRGVDVIEGAAGHIWEKKLQGFTAFLHPSDMSPEAKQLWERFRDGEINIETVKRDIHTASPVLKRRTSE